MSIFKTRGFILKINKNFAKIVEKSKQKNLTNNDFLYTIFTYDYGIINCIKKYSKIEKALDLGYLVNFEIATNDKRSIHKIRNIKITGEFNCENKSFSEINEFLTLLGYILNNVPIGVAAYEIIDILEIIIKSEKIDESRIILARIKIKNILGELDIDNKDKVVNKILKFINNNKYSSIVKLTGIDNKTKNLLKNI